MNRRVLWLSLIFSLVGVAAAGCATFEVETPSEMVAVEEANREYVAMTHRGVVVRSRVYAQGDGANEVPRAEHDFWVEAMRERMRTAGGYALLTETDVTSRDGHRGTRLEFGRDHDGRPYQYWLTLFVTEDNIHVIDTGGPEERFDEARDAVESALNSYTVLR